MIQTIPNDARVSEIEFSPLFSAVCSIGKAPFWGTVHIVYSPRHVLLEFASFEAWLKTFANRELSIEDLCRAVFDALLTSLVPNDLTVTVSAQTTVHAPATATIYLYQGES